jgi:hypothetical protein
MEYIVVICAAFVLETVAWLLVKPRYLSRMVAAMRSVGVSERQCARWAVDYAYSTIGADVAWWRTLPFVRWVNAPRRNVERADDTKADAGGDGT